MGVAAEGSPVNNSISASVHARVYAAPCLEELVISYSGDMGRAGGNEGGRCCLEVVCVRSCVCVRESISLSCAWPTA